ncbi:MAG: hypothetical protein PHR38_02255 [Bacteroidales bacterium]|nr:hypothetical protein [Bacteroidales bacterium]MDD4712488.1 hypothetical protein [Bacteroidales bacterium]
MMTIIKRILFILSVVLFCCKMNVKAAGQEAVYLQTDRTTYIAGESVFYQLYVFDLVTKKRSDLSKVGYIELRAPKSDPALKIWVKVDAGMASGSLVLPDTLPSGVYQMVVFTSVMKNFGEQYFFYKEIMIVNRFDKKLDLRSVKSNSNDSSQRLRTDSLPWIKTDKPVYGPREKVIVTLGKTDIKANVAVSVYEEPQISPADKSIVETLNECVVSVTKLTSTAYLPESKARILRGRVIDESTREGVQAATVFLSCLDSVANLQYASTDSNGIFQMLLSDYYSGKELFFTIKDMPVGQKWKMEIEDNFILSEKWKPELISYKGDFKDYIYKSQDIVYINKSFGLDESVNENPIFENKPHCPQLYRSTVKSVYPSDFVPLDSFPEIVIEILPTVKLTRHDGKYQAYVMISSQGNTYTDREPLIFLDGVYVDDIQKIIDLNSARIKKIDVLDNVRILGDLIFYGAVSIISKSNEIISTVPAPNSLRYKNENRNVGKSFVVVNPDSIKDHHTPFFKQLLYWNPNLELKKDDSTAFDFYTSDNTANFIIKVEGISENGTPISASSVIKVNNPINVIVK